MQLLMRWRPTSARVLMSRPRAACVCLSIMSPQPFDKRSSGMGTSYPDLVMPWAIESTRATSSRTSRWVGTDSRPVVDSPESVEDS